ncbi:MAG: SurA N-terminal domain-containing protein [Alphaproteobacteria bacterium]|nr:SurA N-terminal domain-containing protein [Alphaproteobacteria bacterium]MCB9692528.1 SurA N-terminal domain-containing protein [Alphaproteobacteria bacterium]
MGVLESMRSSSDSTGMQVILVLVIISFVGWMAMPQGDKTMPVARVNGVPIMDTEYRQLYSNAKAERERQIDGPLSAEEEQSLGEQVRQQLIRNEVLLQEAQAMGLTVSNYELQWEIIRTGQYVGYADEDGKLDEEKYLRYLTRRGLTKGAWENQLMEGLLLQKVKQLLFVGTTISEPVLRKIYESNQKKVAVQYVRIRPSAFFSTIEVDDAAIDAWLTEKEGLAKEIYDEEFERRYKHPERMNLAMIRLAAQGDEKPADLLPRMNRIREELVGGADFATLARRWSEDPSAGQGGEMGLKPVLKIAVDVTNAVGDTPQGEITRVIPGDTDVRIYKVIERIEAKEESFDEVKRAIAKEEIRKEKAPALAAEFASKELLPAWKASGSAPLDMLTSKGLNAQSTRLMAATDPPPPFGPPAEVIAKAADLPQGTVIDEVFENGGVYWVAQVSERQDADLAAFEAQRETIRNQELLTRRSQFLENWITSRVAASDVK